MMKGLSVVLLSILLIIPFTLAKEYEVSVEISPREVEVSPYSIATFDILVQNTGKKKDSYSIQVDGIPEDWYSLSHESIDLDGGASTTVYLFITPYYDKAGSFIVSVSAVGHANTTETFTLNVLPDHEIKISIPAVIRSCLCEEDKSYVVVENVGKEYSEDIFLNVSGNASEVVELETKSLTLSPGEKKELPLRIAPACDTEEKTYSLIIEARSTTSYARSAASSTIRKLKCYDFEAYYPEEVKTCAGVETPFQIKVENTGMKADDYEVRVEKLNFTKSVSLSPAEMRTFDLTFKEDELGVYDVQLIVESDFIRKEGMITFVVEQCYGVDLQLDEKELTIKPGTGKLTKPRVRNTGTRPDKFEVTSNVEWTSIKPASLELEPNETRNIYVYYSPEYGVSGSFDVVLKVESENSMDEETVRVNVPTRGPEVTTTTLGASEVPEVPTINITGREITVTDKLLALCKNKLVLSLFIGILGALIILGLIYLLVMRG